ncbi:hypothetical protein J4H63_15015 [Vibrio alginolyticus]|uniref:hypothetical protein n=1 Tax=Vibrio alginolyticus TaxID=663 RepID=UPI001BD5AC8D|nr:hypothetical protein [Vibrio alginolyticus]MBS9970733.1 hypothetical protein [Vibrio alginolyticus]
MKHLTKSEQEERKYLLEVAKVKMDYSKHGATLFTTILGGQVALAGSLFKENPNIEYAGYAMVLMLLASLLAFSFSEGVIRVLESQLSYAKTRPKKKIFNLANWETVKSIFGALFVMSSMYIYLVFALQKELFSAW